MGLYDDPQIDDAGRRSDESVTAFLALFSLGNGFICRPQNPDVGNDFLIELVDGTSAKNWHFAAQLKSVAKPKIIEEGQTISYDFRTNRLGYLTRHIPGQGIIAIFNSATKECFFEYVSEITKRIYAEKGGNEWEKQETISIHIPLKNKLDKDTVRLVHDYYRSLFKNATRMNDSYGHLYDLPPTSTKYGEGDYDLQSSKGIVDFLLAHGIELLNEYEYGLLFALVSRLTDVDIEAHTVILHIAAVAKCESGKYDESKILCRKALKKKDLTDDAAILIRYINLKNQYYQEEIDLDKLVVEMKALTDGNIGLQNYLTIAVNLTLFILDHTRPGQEIPDVYLQYILDLYRKIEAAPLSSRVKFLLRVWNCYSFSLFINLSLAHAAKIAPEIGYTGWARAMLRIMHLDKELTTILNNIKKETPDDNAKLIRAFTLRVSVQHALKREIVFLQLRPETNNVAGFSGNLQGSINQALTACNYFQEEGFKTESYNCLCFGLELLELGKLKLKKELYPDIPALYSLKEAMEEDITSAPYELRIPAILKNIKIPDATDTNAGEDYTPEQVDVLQKIIAQAQMLPPALVAYAVDEINAYREFFKRSRDTDIELISVYYPVAHQPSYSHPVRYILRKKQSGIQSSAHANVDKLLSDWGL